MSSMKKMAREYRLTAARLAAKIQEKRAAGAEEVELRPPAGDSAGCPGDPTPAGRLLRRPPLRQSFRCGLEGQEK